MRRSFRITAVSLGATLIACGGAFTVADGPSDGGDAGEAVDATMLPIGDASIPDATNDVDATGGDAAADASDANDDVDGADARSPVVQLIAALYFSCARREDGTTSCWGDNTYGELATGTVGSVGLGTPLLAAFPQKPISIVGANATGCALLEDNSVVCWGTNAYAQLGIDAGAQSGTPIAIRYGDAGLTGALEVAGGTVFDCARLIELDGGTAGTRTVCWGTSAQGSTGRTVGGNGQQATLPVPGLAGSTQTAVYSTQGCALTTDGFGECWGDGVTPTRIVLSDGGTFGQLEHIGTGTNYQCALRADGSVWCWGTNALGQLGIDGGSVLPTVPTLSGASSLSVNDAHACAIVDGGDVVCWGANYYGELGPDAGTKCSGTPCVPHPIKIALPAAAQTIMAGELTTMAITVDGNVYAWGLNNVGQLASLPIVGEKCPIYQTTTDASTSCSTRPLLVNGIP